MLHHRIALGSAALFGALMTGISLGNYTVGGFTTGHVESSANLTAPGDDSGLVAAGYDLEAASPPIDTSQTHVCTGCDAGLHHDQWQDDAYVADSGTSGDADYSAVDYEKPVSIYVPKPRDLNLVAPQPAADAPTAENAPVVALNLPQAAPPAPVIAMQAAAAPAPATTLVAY